MAKDQAQLVDDEMPDQGVNTLALEAINRSEIDMQITTAKRYPRSLEKFRKSALAMACVDEETAAEMFYSLPRGGKPIEGPTARLAEIMVVCWGNVRAGARVVEVGDTYVSAQGVFHDLEQNVYVSMEVRRRITDKSGRRFNDDMIGVTGNAAASIAYRNVVFKGVPRVYVNAILREAKEVAIGKALSMEQRRARAAEWFAKLGVPEADLLKLVALHAGVARAGLADLTLEDIMMLRGLTTALKDGETTLAEVMRPVREAEAPPAKPGLDGITERLQAQAVPAPTEPKRCTQDHAAIAARIPVPEAGPCHVCGELISGTGGPPACDHGGQAFLGLHPSNRTVECPDCGQDVAGTGAPIVQGAAPARRGKAQRDLPE